MTRLKTLISLLLLVIFALEANPNQLLPKPVLAASNPTNWNLSPTAREQVNNRTQHSKRFVNSDGTFTSVLVQDLHYEVLPGTWANVDLTFRKSGSDEVMDRHPRNRVKITNAGVEASRKDNGRESSG